MNVKEQVSIKKMLKNIYSIEKYVEGVNLEDFVFNEEKQYATVFALCQIGELVKNISDETQGQSNEIPWGTIKGLRNKIVHDYDGINLILIWDIITLDLPGLKNSLEKLIK